jgi:hypothetical protein
MLGLVALLTLGGIVGPLVLYAILRRFGDRAEALASGPSRFGTMLGQLVAAARLLVRRPLVLLGALLVSMTMHGVAMAYFTLLTRVVTAQAIDFGAVATVFPLGLLTVVLPVSPGGVGVGHVAFDRLYHAIGLHGGATVFNVFLIGQIVPCALGVVPYLLLRVRSAVPVEDR